MTYACTVLPSAIGVNVRDPVRPRWSTRSSPHTGLRWIASMRTTRSCSTICTSGSAATRRASAAVILAA